MSHLLNGQSRQPCPVCGKLVGVTTRGRVTEHMRPRLQGEPWPIGCKGSNHTPAVATKIAQASS